MTKRLHKKQEKRMGGGVGLWRAGGGGGDKEFRAKTPLPPPLKCYRSQGIGLLYVFLIQLRIEAV